MSEKIGCWLCKTIYIDSDHPERIVRRSGMFIPVNERGAGYAAYICHHCTKDKGKEYIEELAERILGLYESPHWLLGDEEYKEKMREVIEKWDSEEEQALWALGR
jgi:hypothetical protein